MAEKDIELKVGTILNNKQITEVFHCQYEGGIRKSKKLNVLVLINDPKYGLYQNRWKENVFFFYCNWKKRRAKLTGALAKS